ncbi:asparagine--tRNA ligase [Candidatus Microgenomates bacterium]|nr:asparagine--tRNA ligase [Candidatus Microgenomates bacterium]
MNKDFLIKDASEFVNKEITVLGWVYNLRPSGSIVFLQVRDGSGFIQATVVKNDVKKDVFKEAQKITLETSVEITGLLKEEKRSPTGYEISAKSVIILSLAQDYPIGKKEHGPDFLLKNRHLWLRSKRQWAILRIRNQIIQGINEFLQTEGYTRIDTPIITPSACEGTTTLFEIDYFGQKAYLSQSGQLYLEAAIFSVGKCYDFSPALRAEKSKTRRHLIEFWMMDAEAAFMDFSQMLSFEEELIFFLIERVLKNCREEFKIIERDVKPLESIKKPFARLTYDETVKKLNELGSDIVWGSDLGNDDETMLMTHYQTPVFITHYPAKVKAFYCKKDSGNENLALAADLLAPEGYGEVIGGGQREEDYQKLVDIINKEGLKEKDYEWYLDLRKYGSVIHSGFGVGLERLVAWICKLEHVRESIPFPRLLDRFYP